MLAEILAEEVGLGAGVEGGGEGGDVVKEACVAADRGPVEAAGPGAIDPQGFLVEPALDAVASQGSSPDPVEVVGGVVPDDPAGGTAPDIAGKGIANPSGAIEAYAYLLEYCGHFDMSRRLLQAVHDCIANGEKTGDLGGKLNTMDYTRAVIARALA